LDSYGEDGRMQIKKVVGVTGDAIRGGTTRETAIVKKDQKTRLLRNNGRREGRKEIWH